MIMLSCPLRSKWSRYCHSYFMKVETGTSVKASKWLNWNLNPDLLFPLSPTLSGISLRGGLKEVKHGGRKTY